MADVLFGMRGGLGDIVLFTTLISVLREQFPDDIFICGTSRGYKEWCRSIPLFDSVFTDYRPRYLRQKRGECWYKDRRNGFEIPLLRKAYCLSHPFKGTPEETRNTTHIIDIAAELLGVDSFDRKGTVFLSEESERFAEQYLATFSRPLAVIAPLSNQSKKNAPAGLLGIISDDLHSAGFDCIKILPPGVDMPEIECQKLSIPSLQNVAAVIARADYFVGMDSGLSHVAAAFNRPMTTLHIAYPVARCGVLNPSADVVYFPNNKINDWQTVSSRILSHVSSRI